MTTLSNRDSADSKNLNTARRRPKISFSDVASLEFDGLENLVRNMLTENKNLKSGYYFREYPTVRGYYQNVLRGQISHILERVEVIQEDLDGLATDLAIEIAKYGSNPLRHPSNASLNDLVKSPLSLIAQRLSAMLEIQPQFPAKSTREFARTDLPAMESELLAVIAPGKLGVVEVFRTTLEFLDASEKAAAAKSANIAEPGGCAHQFIAFDADGWEIYNIEGSHEVAGHLTKAFNEMASLAFANMARGVKPSEALNSMSKHMRSKLEEFESYGTTDSDCLRVLDRAMISTFGKDLHRVGLTSVKGLSLR